jgi:hypothetical protein
MFPFESDVVLNIAYARYSSFPRSNIFSFHLMYFQVHIALHKSTCTCEHEAENSPARIIALPFLVVRPSPYYSVGKLKFQKDRMSSSVFSVISQACN